MSFYISGTGSALPAKTVSNDDLSKMMETDDEWIRTRTGIRNRRIMTTETLTELSVRAGQAALSDARLSPQDIDLVICATMRGDTVTPSQACASAECLGIRAMAFDVNAACSAMLYAFDIADGFFATGKVRNVLVLTCEAMSKQIDWQDRASCVLFGDGAGAVVLSKGDGLNAVHAVCVPDAHMIRTPSHSEPCPFDNRPIDKMILFMAGKEVYKFAVTVMVSEMEKVLEQAGLTAEDIDYVLPHQANVRIIDAAKKRFRLPDEKVLMNMADYGNMSSTSISVLLDEHAKKGTFKKGDKLLLVAFGAGMTAAATIITWAK